MRVARNLDLGLLVIALALFLAAGFPIVGWLTGAGAWLLQRAIRELLTRRAERATDPRALVGLLAGSMIGRGWLVAGIIVAVGIANRAAGLSAAILFLALFTVQFTTMMILRPMEQPPPRRPAPPSRPEAGG